jgi:hypothetical protein
MGFLPNEKERPKALSCSRPVKLRLCASSGSGLHGRNVLAGERDRRASSSANPTRYELQKAVNLGLGDPEGSDRLGDPVPLARDRHANAVVIEKTSDDVAADRRFRQGQTFGNVSDSKKGQRALRTALAIRAGASFPRVSFPACALERERCRMAGAPDRLLSSGLLLRLAPLSRGR